MDRLIFFAIFALFCGYSGLTLAPLGFNPRYRKKRTARPERETVKYEFSYGLSVACYQVINNSL
jgi:hypothetical protein